MAEPEITHALELSALLTNAQRDLAAALEMISLDEFPTAHACARNALVAASACEEKLRSGTPE